MIVPLVFAGGIFEGLDSPERKKMMNETVTTQHGAAYLQRLANSFGVGVTEADCAEAERLRTTGDNWRSDINRLFFEEIRTRSAQPVVIPPEIAQRLVNCDDPSDGPQVRRMLEEIANLYSSAKNRQTQMIDYLTRAAQVRRDMLSLMRKTSDLTDEVKAICEGGWYTFDPDATKALSLSGDLTLVFRTKPITLRELNEAAGIDLAVPMGSFAVHYRPSQEQVTVWADKDNILVDSFIHPHVDDGHVCWGNAYTPVMAALGERKPSVAFSLLKALLETYNEGSPFRALQQFAAVRDPKLLEGTPTEYRRYQRAWVREEDRDDRIEVLDVRVGEDGEDQLIGLYHRYYAGTQIRANENIYARTTNARYMRFDEGLLLEWY